MFYVYIFCPMLEIALHYPSTPLANVIDNALLCLFILKLSPTLFSCTKWWDCTLQQSCYACLLSATNLTKSHFIKARSQLIYGPVYVLSVSQGSVFELEALQLKKKKKQAHSSMRVQMDMDAIFETGLLISCFEITNYLPSGLLHSKKKMTLAQLKKIVCNCLHLSF